MERTGNAFGVKPVRSIMSYKGLTPLPCLSNTLSPLEYRANLSIERRGHVWEKIALVLAEGAPAPPSSSVIVLNDVIWRERHVYYYNFHIVLDAHRGGNKFAVFV